MINRNMSRRHLNKIMVLVMEGNVHVLLPSLIFSGCCRARSGVLREPATNDGYSSSRVCAVSAAGEANCVCTRLASKL